jgi:hypothetical protein
MKTISSGNYDLLTPVCTPAISTLNQALYTLKDLNSQETTTNEITIIVPVIIPWAHFSSS